MYRASDERENAAWLSDLEEAADRLDLEAETRSRAADLFLSTLPESDRSKAARLAAAIYVAGLATGDQRSQGTVASAVGVSRLSVQNHWKGLLETAGLEAPDW